MKLKTIKEKVIHSSARTIHITYFCIFFYILSDFLFISMINNIETKINFLKIMATRDTKENYNAYMRDYYKKNNQNKTTKINNKIDEIVMNILKAGETKVTKRDIIKSLVELKKMVKLPKMEFTVPEEIADFLNEDIKNPLTNVK